MTLTHLLIPALLAGSAVTSLQVTAVAPASPSSAHHQRIEPAGAGESVVLVFPAADRFGVSWTGGKRGVSDSAPHPVAVVLQADRSSSRTDR